jgi:DNA-binding NarL/FixJ family response regulator
MAALGFLELSLEQFEAAAQRLAPMVAGAASMGVNEPVSIPFAGDAAEALIALGQMEQATVIVDQLEHNGRRLDRAWALAIGARCRALLLAASARVDEAMQAGERALIEHDRLGMPIERARTLLVMGQLERRRGKRKAAKALLSQAQEIFGGTGALLWADKAQRELQRLGMHPGRIGQLTPSEQRVGQLAATGLTNREVAAALFISPKTVEANLARVYQKLEIRSRAELGRRMAEISHT